MDGVEGEGRGEYARTERSCGFLEIRPFDSPDRSRSVFVESLATRKGRINRIWPEKYMGQIALTNACNSIKVEKEKEKENAM